MGFAQRFFSIASRSNSIMSIKEVRQTIQKLASVPKYRGAPEPEVTNQDDLPRRRPSDSAGSAVIPLGDDPKLQLKYASSVHTVRFGRVLEDLDTFAVWLGVRHVLDPSDPEWRLPFSIVTAHVDRIDVTDYNVSPEADLLLSGQVTWVGRSTMETTVRLTQDSHCALEATFLLGTRQLTRNKSALVNGLLLETEEDHRLFQRGKEARRRRKRTTDEESVMQDVPESQEVKDIHRFFLDTVDLNSASFQRRIKPFGRVWMEETILKSVVICPPEEPNVYDKLFGGFLMRAAFELAWMNAHTFSTLRPRILAVDDIHFRWPVHIGSLLFLSSQVAYTQDCRMQVKVRAEVVNVERAIRHTTNIFHFTFGVEKEVRPVIPKTYAEALMYMDARRHFNASLVHP